MDGGTFLYYLFGVISALYVVHFGFYLTGANIYDMWQLHRRRFLKQHSLLHPYRPLVTVLIPAHNEEKVIVRCLESVRRSSYTRLQVIVIDDASRDATSRLVRQYAHEHPALPLRLVRKRINAGKGEALNYALRRYVEGELVMTLDADSALTPGSVASAVAYFTDQTIAGVAANVQILSQFTVLGVLQKFEHMIGYRAKKVYSLTNCEFVVGGVASTYRMSILKAVGFYDTDTMTEDIGLSMKIITNGNRAHRVVYGVDVVAMTEGVQDFKTLVRQRYRWKYGSLQNIFKHSHLIGNTDRRRFTRMLTLYRMPMAVLSEVALLLSPVLWGYVLYITFSERSLLLVMGAYLTITFYTLLTIWQDEHLRLRERLHLTAYAPIAYFIYYIMDIVQVVGVVRCLARAHHLVKRRQTSSTWVSPERMGQEVAVG